MKIPLSLSGDFPKTEDGANLFTLLALETLDALDWKRETITRCFYLSRDSTSNIDYLQQKRNQRLEILCACPAQQNTFKKLFF